ncbi:hypothetical protein DB30_04799 [Enhygromyxa salina]|uniref:Uncharacterized protein n=1 Tax=Enhygromyxa salina TaxID=215803 RepID=A0A0C2D855_9BACT|nr:hypothetical protein DB30_04799 [Enhygromyxa salina]
MVIDAMPRCSPNQVWSPRSHRREAVPTKLGHHVAIAAKRSQPSLVTT